MNTRGARQRLGLERAGQLASMGARLRTIHAMTGMQPRQLQRLFFPDPRRIPRGRAPDSGEWYHHANLIRQVDACLLAASFRTLRSAAWPAEDALIASYRTYQAMAGHRSLMSLDRAFSVVSHLEGLWQARTASLALDRCRTCGCQFIATLGEACGAARHCPFCRLRARFAADPRLRNAFCSFPAALDIEPQPQLAVPAGPRPVRAAEACDEEGAGTAAAGCALTCAIGPP